MISIEYTFFVRLDGTFRSVCYLEHDVRPTACVHSGECRMVEVGCEVGAGGVQSDPRRRMAEPLIIALIFVTASMLLPQFAPCIQPSCVNQQVRPYLAHE